MMKDQAHELKQKMLQPSKNVTVYAVVSGKGGVGKSNITINLGIALNQSGKSVLLIDGDLGMANLDILAGVSSRSTLMDFFESGKPIDDILIHYQDGLDILPGGSGMLSLQNSQDEVIKEFITSLIGSGRYDVIMIDAGAGVDAKLISFASVAHEVILVTVPEPTAMADAYSLVKILSVFEIKHRIHLIVNQVSGQKQAQETYERLDKVIGTFLNAKIELLGYVATDMKVRDAVSRQIPFLIAYPVTLASRNITTLCDRMLERNSEFSWSSLGDLVFRFIKVFGA